MSKRLSDTEIWKKPWFFDLPDKYKLFWFYILSDCDAAGIWTVNQKITKAYLGELDFEKIIELFKNQITVLNGGCYWLINDFVKFQYGYPLKETAPMYKKIDTLLKQRNLNIDTLYDTVSIQYQQSIDTLKEEDKDKEKEKEEKKEKISKIEIEFKSFWEHYPRKVGKIDAEKAWIKTKDRPDIQTIIESIEAHKKTEQWQKDGGQYIPHPATFINRGGWFDEIEAKPEININRIKELMK